MGGPRGPVPKRSTERRRRNKPDQPLSKLQLRGIVKAPPAKKEWHSRAKALWRATKESGQALFYEPTDWQTLAYVCDLMTTLFRPGRLTHKLENIIRQALADSEDSLTKEERLYLEWMLAPPRPSAQMVASMNSLMASLGLTEGDRRRMRLEIERLPEEEPAEVTSLDDYRDAFGG